MSEVDNREPKRCDTEADERQLMATDENTYDVNHIIEGTVESHVFWQPESFFEEHFGDGDMVAYAFVDGVVIYLNKSQKDKIDHRTLAHEYGHNLGLGHEFGSLMDPWEDGNEDGKGGESLHEMSRTVFENLDNAKVIDWSEASIQDVLTIIKNGNMGITSFKDVMYAINQYNSGDRVDAYWTDNFTEKGGEAFPTKPKGTFYTAQE